MVHIRRLQLSAVLLVCVLANRVLTLQARVANELDVSLSSVFVVIFYDVNFYLATLVPDHTSHLRGAEKSSRRFGVLLLWRLCFDVGGLGLVYLSEKVGF